MPEQPAQQQQGEPRAIPWRAWEPAAFDAARESDRPVLLLIVASWCRFCRELESTTFSNHDVVRLVEDLYVPVRVDKDRRPDVNARYNCGGWPTIAFLTPQADLIAGETFLTAAELIPILERVAPFFREHRTEIHERVEELEEVRIRQQERRELGHLNKEMIDFVGTSISESFDRVHGGFGTGSKFPHPEAIDFALAQYARHGDERMREVVVKTLDGMGSGEIYDSVEGGFFRYAQGRDWRAPHTEKVLDSNAARLGFYLEAFQLFGGDNYKKVAVDTIAWLESRLLDSTTGAFFGSQDADPEYYGLSIERRRTRNAPRIDRTIYADWNAMTASALFLASVVLREPRLRLQATRTLDFIVEEMFDDRRGVYHYFDETFHLPGLLSDQVYTLRALIDAIAVVGDNRYLATADRLATFIRQRHHASTGGGYYDLSHDAAQVKQPSKRNRSILENSILAECFIKLGHLVRDDHYISCAREALETFSQDFRQFGYYASGYARAVDLLIHPPLVVTIVGDPAEARAEKLRLAALECYIPSRVVDCIHPVADAARLQKSGLPVREAPTAFISIGRTSYAEVTDPEDMPSVLRMAGRDAQ
jgi:hypothetical protein